MTDLSPQTEIVEIISGKLYIVGYESNCPGACIMHDAKTGEHAWIDYGEVVLALDGGRRTDLISEKIRILYQNCVYIIHTYFLTKMVK